jgi:hypothetical protein
MASTKVSEEKKRLLEESERYRRALETDFQNLKTATAWVPKTLGVVRATSPLLALSAPIIGLLFRRKKKREPMPEHNGKPNKGLVATALLVIELLWKAKPFWDTFRRPRPRPVPRDPSIPRR